MNWRQFLIVVNSSFLKQKMSDIPWLHTFIYGHFLVYYYSKVNIFGVQTINMKSLGFYKKVIDIFAPPSGLLRIRDNIWHINQ